MSYRLSQKMKIEFLLHDGYVFVINEPKIKVLTRDLDIAPHKYFLVCYFGSSSTPSVYSSFNDSARRQERISRFVLAARSAIKAREEFKADAKAARAAMENQLKPGDLLHASWGWEQTNCDFYQVIKTTPKGVYVREVATVETRSTGSMSGYLRPIKDKFASEDTTFYRLSSPVSVKVKYGIASRIDNPETDEFYYSTYA